LAGTPEPFYVVFNDSTIKLIRIKKKRRGEEQEKDERRRRELQINGSDSNQLSAVCCLLSAFDST
jgi:hypothetical protein